MLIFFLRNLPQQLSNTHLLQITPLCLTSAACYKARHFILLWEGWVFETHLCHIVKCVYNMHLSRQIWIDFWIYVPYRSGRHYRGYLRRAYACLSLFTTAKSTRTLLSQTGPHLSLRRPVLRREDGNKGAKRQCDSEGILRKGEPFHTQPQLSIILQITNMRTARFRHTRANV